VAAEQLPSVLIADEEPEVRTLLERALSGAGLRVWSAGSPAEALTLYREHQPNLVLTELEFKDMDGVQLLRAIRGVTPQARCCLMTGSSTVYTVADLQLMGVLDVFVKPFDDLGAFADAVRQLAEG
jgi:two-component system nitrogen regulation response regulator GlnG